VTSSGCHFSTDHCRLPFADYCNTLTYSEGSYFWTYCFPTEGKADVTVAKRHSLLDYGCTWGGAFYDDDPEFFKQAMQQMYEDATTNCQVCCCTG
jgi:hypothetical protein